MRTGLWLLEEIVFLGSAAPDPFSSCPSVHIAAKVIEWSDQSDYPSGHTLASLACDLMPIGRSVLYALS